MRNLVFISIATVRVVIEILPATSVWLLSALIGVHAQDSLECSRTNSGYGTPGYFRCIRRAQVDAEKRNSFKSSLQARSMQICSLRRDLQFEKSQADADKSTLSYCSNIGYYPRHAPPPFCDPGCTEADLDPFDISLRDSAHEINRLNEQIHRELKELDGEINRYLSLCLSEFNKSECF
jgi:hypothetical protein